MGGARAPFVDLLFFSFIVNKRTEAPLPPSALFFEFFFVGKEGERARREKVQKMRVRGTIATFSGRTRTVRSR